MTLKEFIKWPTFGYVWLVGSLVLGAILIFVCETYKDKKYELIIKTSSLHDRIIWVDFDHDDYITLKTGRKINVADMENINYTPSYFSEMVAPYDSLVKEVNNDTLYLIKGNKKYFYIVTINE
jgi:hypothetical protein